MNRSNLRAVDPDRLHPRDIARQRIAKWKSNAEREKLPTVNVTTGSGAPLLDRDKVLKWEPKHMGRK